jgi:hypothetical protein
MGKLKLFVKFVVVGAIGILIGRYAFKPKETTKEVVKVVEVEKIVKVETKKVITKIKETVKKDGTKETETTIVEDSSKKEVGEVERSQEVSKVSESGSGITLGLLALKDIDRFSEKTHVGVIAGIPLFGNLKIISSLDTAKRVGIGLALEL